MTGQTSGASLWVPPVNRVLAYFASGRVFTELFPAVLRIGVALALIAVFLVWLAIWFGIYTGLERWSLVIAFVLQVLWPIPLYVVFRIVLLRADHLSAVPRGDFASLEVFSLSLRLVAEIQVAAVLGFALLGLVASQVFAVMGSTLAGGRLEALISKVGVSAALGVGVMVAALSKLIGAVVVFFVLYAIASAIDAFVRIELNTRSAADRR